MKRKNIALLAAATMSLVATAGVGRAADVIAGPTTAGWSGPYAGLFGGYNDVSFDWNEAAGLGSYDGNITAFNGGVFGGYNFATGPVVLGVEGEASLSTGDASFSNVPGPDEINAAPNWQFGLRGRVGYDAGRFLPYVTAGYSWMSLDTSWDLGGGKSVDVNESHHGVMVGVGADIALTEHVFGRLEYMHTWLSEERYTYCNTSCSADITPGVNSFRLGLGYRL